MDTALREINMVCNSCDNEIYLGDDLEAILDSNTFVCYECECESDGDELHPEDGS